MKVIALWDNYGEGTAALYGPLKVPQTVWLSDSCLLRERKPFYIPEFDDDFRLFPTVAIKLSRLGKNIPARFASRYWHEASVWINIRACGMMQAAREAGIPFTSAVAYDCSLVSAPFFEMDEDALSYFSFTLLLNDKEKLHWQGCMLRAGADRAIEAVSRTTILKMGDVLLLGFAPQGVPVTVGDRVKIITSTLHSDDTQEILTEFAIK